MKRGLTADALACIEISVEASVEVSRGKKDWDKLCWSFGKKFNLKT